MIKFWRGNLYPQERLRERLQRARAQHGYRFADDEKNRDEELGHWLAASLIFAANCIATKDDEICRNEDFSMPPNGDEDDFLRIQTRNFSSEQRVSNDDPENRVPTRNARLPRRRGLGKEFLIRANRAQSEN